MRSGARQHGPPLNSLWQIKQRQMMEDPAVMSVTDTSNRLLKGNDTRVRRGGGAAITVHLPLFLPRLHSPDTNESSSISDIAFANKMNITKDCRTDVCGLACRS